jgi:hypothetical protein
MWCGCINPTSAYTTRNPHDNGYLRFHLREQAQDLFSYSFNVDPSTSQRRSGPGFAQKESTSVLPSSAPANRCTTKQSRFFILTIAFDFLTWTWRRHNTTRPLPPSFGRSGFKQVSFATSAFPFFLPRWKKIMSMILGYKKSVSTIWTSYAITAFGARRPRSPRFVRLHGVAGSDPHAAQSFPVLGGSQGRCQIVRLGLGRGKLRWGGGSRGTGGSPRRPLEDSQGLSGTAVQPWMGC